MERLVREIDNDVARWRRAEILGAVPPREFEIPRDPEVAPLATFVAHLQCAGRNEDKNIHASTD